MMVPIADQAVEGGNPKRAVAVFRQGVDRVILQFRRVGPVEDGEAHAIEAGQPKPGAEPQIAVASLLQTGDAILRQALIGGPTHYVKALIGGDAESILRRRCRPEATGIRQSHKDRALDGSSKPLREKDEKPPAVR